MHEQISPLSLELLDALHRSITSYRRAVGKHPAAICFSVLDPLGALTHVYGVPCTIDLKLEPGAVDIIDSEGWAVGRLWKDGSTRP